MRWLGDRPGASYSSSEPPDVPHLTPVRTAIIRKMGDNESWRGRGDRDPSPAVGGNVNWYGHHGKWYDGASKNYGCTTMRSSNLTPGGLSEKQNHYLRETSALLPPVSAGVTHDSRGTEATVSMGRWTETQDVTSVCNCMLSSLKTKAILPSATTRMDWMAFRSVK